MYLQPTYLNSSLFSVSIRGQSLFTTKMREYIGQVHYVQAVVASSHNTFVINLLDNTVIPDPTQVRLLYLICIFDILTHVMTAHSCVPLQFVIKPARFVSSAAFDPATHSLQFDVTTDPDTGSAYLILRFKGSKHALFLFVDPKPVNPPVVGHPGVVSISDFGVNVCAGDAYSQGDAIQAAINKVLADEDMHTLVFPYKSCGRSTIDHRVYLTHDLHVTNSTGKRVTLYLEPG